MDIGSSVGQVHLRLIEGTFKMRLIAKGMILMRYMIFILQCQFKLDLSIRLSQSVTYDIKLQCFQLSALLKEADNFN